MLNSVSSISEMFHNVNLSLNPFVLNELGQSRLHIAAKNNQIDEIKNYIEKGLDVNLKDVSGKTPLHYCARNNCLESVMLLLANNALVNISDEYGNQPLREALFSANRDINVVEQLLMFGADFEHQNESGFSVLSIVQLLGDNEIVDLFDSYSVH